MAIMGTIICEDISVNYVVHPAPVGADGGLPSITVTIVDGQTGESETYTPNAPDFMIALGTMLNWQGASLDMDAAERAQPNNPALRFIP